MQIIKNKQIIDDSWGFVTDDAALTSGNISVSLARWKQNKQLLLNHEGKLGIRINPDDSLDEIADELKEFQLIELDFPDFADGRLFSLAWLLRGRYNYQGEIRAIGHYMPDQAFYLSRVGVNAFNPGKTEDLPIILSHLNDFSIKYQNSIN